METYQPASEDEIEGLWGEMQKIDNSLLRTDTQRIKIADKLDFQDFYIKHCRDIHYLFSVKKCGVADCKYCLPPQLEVEEFETLHHIPDPVPNGERYHPFDKLYGTETSERYRPSLSSNTKADKGMPFNPTKQTALNVGHVIQCEECSKWRLLHSSHKLNGEDLLKLEELLEDVRYSCGSSFNDMDSEIGVNVYVRADLNCASTIEIPYYSAKYEDICINCGSIDNLELSEHLEHYPRCIPSKLSGKKQVKRCTRVFKTKTNKTSEDGASH